MSVTLAECNKLAATLESQELDAPNGVPPDAVYEKLLAIYLLQNDIISAKLLWKRIPVSVKQRCPELERVWAVGRELYTRDRAAVFAVLTSTQWGPTVAPIMAAVTEAYRERTIELIANAYSSIGVDDVSRLLGLERTAALQKAQSLGWQIDEATQMILPKPFTKDRVNHMPSEKQLERLTEYISFLEKGL
ncbi:CSN8/PSMD8/EIF3K [Trinorchestia longiramus]|nr:CSN8/PSMD8/EIF3K [Trinorchestia longiramus]